MRPIDADDVIERLDMICDAGGCLSPVTKAVRSFCKGLINRQPTIEAEPDNGWISVKDRLPEPGIPVLALQFDVPHSRRTRYRLVRLVVYDTIDPSTGKKMISWFPNYGGHCVENIAYWQPLPKTPKGEE